MKKIIIIATSLFLISILTGCDDLGSYADEDKLELLDEVIEDELVNSSILYTEEWVVLVYLALIT